MELTKEDARIRELGQRLKQSYLNEGKKVNQPHVRVYVLGIFMTMCIWILDIGQGFSLPLFRSSKQTYSQFEYNYFFPRVPEKTVLKCSKG